MTPSFQVLYISDLDHIAAEEHLYQAFARWDSGVRSIRLIRDVTRPMALAHAFVNFTNHKDAADAYEQVQPLFVNSSYCRVVPYDVTDFERPSRFDLTAGASVFIKNLDPAISVAVLWQLFLPYGNIIGCRVAINELGLPRGFGYVTYTDPASASAAIEAMNSKFIGRRRISVHLNVPRTQRGTKLFVRFGEAFSDATEAEPKIREAFSEFGSLDTVAVPRHADSGEPRGFAFVSFREAADAERAVNELTKIEGHEVQVSIAVAPGSRGVQRDQLQLQMLQQQRETQNLFVRPLEEHIRNEDLRKLFEPYGKVLSTRVMLDPRGNSRGFGFVSFEDPLEASRAASSLNGEAPWGRPLFVAPARREGRGTKWSPIPAMQALTAAMAGGLPGTVPSSPIPGGIPGAIPGTIPIGLPGLVPSGVSGGAGSVGSEYFYLPYEYYDQFAMTPISSKEELGERLHPAVLKHSAIGGDPELASRVTGVLLEQAPQNLMQWLSNELVLDRRIQQATDAYHDWVRSQELDESTDSKAMNESTDRPIDKSEGPANPSNDKPAGKPANTPVANVNEAAQSQKPTSQE